MNADQLQNILFLARQGMAPRVVTDSTQDLMRMSHTLDAGEQALGKMRLHEAELAKQADAAKKTVEAEKAAEQVINQAETRAIPKTRKAKSAAVGEIVEKDAPGP